MYKTKQIGSSFVIFIFLTLLVSAASHATTAKEEYFKAETAYKKLLNDKKLSQERNNWLSCIKKFQSVYKRDPDTPWAAAGMYMSGKLYQELYQQSNRESDKKEAIDAFERISKRYPKSDYRAKALKEIASITQPRQGPPSPSFPPEKKQEGKQGTVPVKKRITVKNSTAPAPAPADEPPDAPAVNGQATVNYLRYSTYPDLTRISVELDRDADYTYGFLKEDTSLKTPMRMYVDVKNSRLCARLKKILPEKENNLKIAINKNLEVRISQNTPDVVRVVMYNLPYKGVAFTAENYDINTFHDPYRIVMDIKGKAEKNKPLPQNYMKERAYTKKKEAPLQNVKVPAADSIAKQLALGVRCIVIDPGHGGKDYGAPGYHKGVHEKDIVLQLAKHLAQRIRNDLKYEVFLTREDDRFLTLEERTQIANKKNADLFISLHTNASKDNSAHGIETYFLNLATNKEAIMVAAKENATSQKNISDLQSILTDLMRNAKINESSRLAGSVQNTLFSDMSKKYDRVKNKGVKQAPFYVLLGAKMPSILIETSFISNPTECERLTNTSYQNSLCDAIVGGIDNYIKGMNAT